jgi:chromate transporter
MLMPAASLMYVVTLFWQKAQKSKWRIAVEKGFAPLMVGLIMATSLVMSRAAYARRSSSSPRRTR